MKLGLKWSGKKSIDQTNCKKFMHQPSAAPIKKSPYELSIHIKRATGFSSNNQQSMIYYKLNSESTYKYI